ncbi:hypothetical protein PYCCODRAFT_1397227 [Trametes coccinea BRFM310]|uniref:F-box domain-containing protein n=1 Tax=Trametes coccinea (strain BRFM310) TaxID=1353009 RepID=A0A1Y2IB24_TRAC3|nr:hypothetical protein PYCCODRAFT_1397227 [Trametes coccinea BRFM310]
MTYNRTLPLMHGNGQTTAFDHSRLPLELWRLIIEFAPNADQRTCLFVSQSFHEIALYNLFSRVIIWFGLWKVQWSEFPDEGREEEDALLMSQRNNTSWEILRRITRDAAFARIVKDLSVRAYAMDDRVFEMRCLLDALECLPNLHTFRWYGEGPPMESIVLDTLSRSCSATLTQLSMPIISDCGPLLARFSRLQFFCLGGESAQALALTSLEEEEEIYTCLENVSHTLRRLWVQGTAIWSAPMRLLSGLQEMFLLMPCNLDGLSIVFHHCDELRSFGLFTQHSNCAEELRCAMETMPNALPQLTSFKLHMYSQSDSLALTNALYAFLRSKKELRRLDVQTRYVSEVDQLAPFYDLLPTLPKLEVVGMKIKGRLFTQEDLKRLDERLPLALTALLIEHNYLSLEEGSLQGLIDMLRKRKGLRYLHILDCMYHIDMKQQLLEDHPQSLELLGYGPHLRWIDRDPETGLSAYTRSWSYASVEFRNVHSFGCEDWEWLLRSHGLGGPDDLPPGIYT